MPAERIAEHLDRFVRSAELAVAAAFDMVQVHAAHGYLLSLLLTTVTNRRTDGFSPSAGWIEEFIPRLRGVLSNAILSIRLSLFTGVLDAQEELSAARRLTVRLAEAGVDLIDLSAGLYTVDRQLIYPNRGDGTPPYYPAAQLIAGDVACLVSFAGNVTDLRVFRSGIPSNLLVAMGRAFIADSQFARKSSEGRFDEIRWCKRTGHCHYFSRGKQRLECGVNPNLE
jgi:2,4-dienoyl-CoA reductase-like NADH-dependent reductase (Old Yellow Enzyme family)